MPEFEIKTKELSRELVDTTYTKKLECKNYWDSHGKRIEYATTQHAFDRLKKVELYRVKRQYLFETIPTYTAEFLLLYVEGKLFEDLGEITSYRPLKTKIKLECCIGAG